MNPEQMMFLRPTMAAADLMLTELVSDIQHSSGVENSEKWRLSHKIHDIQLLLSLSRQGGTCTR